MFWLFFFIGTSSGCDPKRFFIYN